LRVVYSTTSVLSFSDGSGAKICVPRAMNSLRTSFWMKIPNRPGSTPRFSASATNQAAQM
jgi:hypothetical protein